MVKRYDLNRQWNQTPACTYYQLNPGTVFFSQGPKGDMGEQGLPGDRGEKGEMGLSGPAVSCHSLHSQQFKSK